MLARGRGVPLYYQLHTILRKMILSGEIQAGAPFPTENLLVQKYKVSRMTVRQALTELGKEQLITRQQGKGTFVTEKAERMELPKLWGTGMDLIDFELRGAGRVAVKTRIIDFSRVTASKRITDLFGLPEGSEVIRIERVRLTNSGPIYYLLNYLPPDLGEQINPKLLRNKTLMEILEVDLGIAVKKATQTIEADILDNYVGSLLDTREADPCLVLKRVIYDHNERAVEYLEASFRADRYMYTDILLRQKKGADQWSRK